MPVPPLDKDEIWFPDPSTAYPDGLLAYGGDLSVDRLLFAYTNGIFPWFSKEEPILWWCPNRRYIIRPEKVHISHSMKKYLKKHDCYISFNRDFADTMHRCRMKREHLEGSWISDEMEAAYQALHREGFAISVEAYVDGALAGGLYGVAIGKCFFGESMFTELENGSKIALILFCNFLAEHDFHLVDCQFHTDHLETMGGEHISWEEYKELLKDCFPAEETAEDGKEIDA